MITPKVLVEGKIENLDEDDQERENKGIHGFIKTNIQ